MTEANTARRLMSEAIVTDMTFPCCPRHLLFPADAMLYAALDQFSAAGVRFVSLTVGLDHYPSIEFTIKDIAAYRAAIEARPDAYRLVQSYSDIEAAVNGGQLAVGMHFQGTNPLADDLNMVGVYRKLGIGHMLLAYNSRNSTGDGCHEKENAGLSLFGRMLIERMNAEGVIVDLTHTGERTALDAAEVSTEPVICSHSSARALFDHERNIRDVLIRACAASGGVVGVTGVGIFMSQAGDDISAETIANHVRHVADLVGPEHVGFGLDYVTNTDALVTILEASSDRFPSDNPSYRKPEFHFAGPEVIVEVAEVLLRDNYPEAAVRGVLGDNFVRVCRQVWRSSPKRNSND